MLEFTPEKELRIEQLTMACNLQYPDTENHYCERYEDDYSQLPAEEFYLKLSTSR